MPPGDFSDEDMISMLPYLTRLESGQVYLEIGVKHGRSLYFARHLTNPNVEIWGIDIGKDPRVKDAHFIQADSKTCKFHKPINLLFIDGDHSYEGVKADIQNWGPRVMSGFILFHDCDETSPGVVKAVDEFFGSKAQKLHPKSSMVVVKI